MLGQVASFRAGKGHYRFCLMSLTSYATTEGFSDKKAEKEDHRHSLGCVSKAIHKPDLQCERLFPYTQWGNLKKGADDDK